MLLAASQNVGSMDGSVYNDNSPANLKTGSSRTFLGLGRLQIEVGTSQQVRHVLEPILSREVHIKLSLP